MMGQNAPKFPALGLVLSGGHTLLLKINDLGRYCPIATTIDDAIGEAFDKVATLLGLPYPGGPHIETLAKQGILGTYALKAGKVKKSPLDFSFSGLKTSVLYAAAGQNARTPKELSAQEKANLATSFQETAFQDILAKTKLAMEKFPCEAIYLGGGVCNNQRLRALFYEAFPHIQVHFPPLELTLDNAAMIAGLGYHKFLKNPISDPLDQEAFTRTQHGIA